MASGWSRDPTEDQQRYYELLGDACAYETNTSRGLLILHRKVGYAMCGIPDEESKCDNAHTGYSKNKYKTMKAVVDFIRDVNKEKTEERDQLDMAIIFVFVEYEKQVLQYPVFRILLTKSKWKFVDTNCRVYSSWQDYLKSNELPEGKFCWPLNGIYSGDDDDKVQLGWGITPAAQPSKKVVEAVDKASTVAALGATGVYLLGMVTPLGPVMAVAGACGAVSGLYGAARSGTSLLDRGNHGQTVNPLSDRQAAMSWISVAGSVVGMAAGAAASRAATLARNGQVMSKTGQITCNALNVTSLAVSATGISIGAISLSERIKEGEATPLEVFQFSASLLFFAHATVNFQTASQIIKETQKGVIEDYEKSLRSNRHRKQFKKLAKNTAATGENPMDGNARVIRGIRSIDNKDDFFAGMVRTRKDFGGHKAVFSENGNIVVNGGAEIHPMKLYELGKQQRREFLSLAKQASQGKVSDATLKARFDSVLSTNTAGSSGRNTSQDSDVMEAENILTSQLQQGTQGITIGRNEVMLMLSVVDELTVLVCSKTDNKYAKWWHLIWHHVSKLVREMCNTYDEALNLEKQIHNFVDKRQFDLINGIQMANVFMHFVCQVHNRYKDHIEQLIKDIEKKWKTNDNICEKCKQAM
ncbi:uncharacterized protein LOC126262260 [Schistocerca nitens]|uniref:uncharacterized protein LOC126262260 n=1 Tax=Schistocerca nitens TaxID=7011 RepID=UPI00211781B1|nr:uncharacterized protein LOC126262260 [Schistocerca nitens]XP_049814707.1 uncharacterized protein LOC126262260 [Schistocerca nitens]XP_049814708.1 uncharacterized protein LOC126262260 [Schistocerca nitens]XP_049814709.1 uncharacterized protein LOC126262260 [Schistocerca nitens]XP_049814710.1 uncharacterized protein LOC126262260 [Schistocerca nitens]XP_049814711.1 uncharacterized protein LOC126262260 [Schistocerca nitens]XP_049814712.1 uncharacterized protein LOC126262260 [Schistocerca niten